MDNVLMNRDDAFLLGSVCGAAIGAGMGGDVRDIFRCLQQERPDNAGGFILEAMMLQQDGRIDEALEFLIAHRALEKPENGEEVTALYALLLVQAGDIKGGYEIAKAAVELDTVVSESARGVFAGILAEIDATEVRQ